MAIGKGDVYYEDIDKRKICVTSYDRFSYKSDRGANSTQGCCRLTGDISYVFGADNIGTY